MQNLSPVSDEKDIVTKGYVDAVKSAAAINKSTLGYSGKNLFNPNAVNWYQPTKISIANDGTITSTVKSDSRSWGLANAEYFLTLQAGKYIIKTITESLDDTVTVNENIRGYNEVGTQIINIFPNIIGTQTQKFTITETTTIGFMFKIMTQACKIMIYNADITDSTYEPYVPDANTRLLALEDKHAQSGTLLASTSIGSSGGDITIENLSAYSSAWAYIDGHSTGIEFATNVIIPIAYLAKSTSNSVKLAGGIPSAAYITSSGPQAPKDTSAYITAKVSGNVLNLTASSPVITLGNVKIVAM